ncbi:hypothetical protein CBF34_07205 [Vagococcus penaei]|uniref:phage immunity protein n=1 Tax=Vagococcus penaei TaxID=633807 RepID=UPI000F89378C|nr:phage immunity protein [Vagococcus penaei]RSU01438.1 hypothetical protein CBF34_07205 [Vagococcus penaei]
MKKLLIVGVTIFSVSLLTACGSSEKKENSKDSNKINESSRVVSSSSTNNEAKQANDKFFSLGETAETEKVKYTLKSVSLTDERNQSTDKKPNNVIKIEYTIDNASDKDVPVGMDVEVYDSSQTKMETYPLNAKFGSVASGKNMEATAFYGLDELGETEIWFAPVSGIVEPVKFKVDVK